jgi:hypothetical protein
MGMIFQVDSRLHPAHLSGNGDNDLRFAPVRPRPCGFVDVVKKRQNCNYLIYHRIIQADRTGSGGDRIHPVAALWRVAS